MIILEKYEKDKLTIENIILDYKTICSKRIKLIVLFLIFLPLISFLLGIFIIKVPFLYKLIFGFFLFLLLWYFCVLFFDLFKECKAYKDITKQKFSIVVDILDQKKEYAPPGKAVLYDKSKIFSFNKYKDFVLPSCLPLPSARNFDLNQKELFDSSKIGDKFYLVIYNKKYILIAYNTKFFYLSN